MSEAEGRTRLPGPAGQWQRAFGREITPDRGRMAA